MIMKQKIKNIGNELGFLWQFSLDDLKNKYSNSIIGIGWGFLQPLITIVVYWFVFQLGFRSQPVEDFPFILWLVSGLIPWFFMSEAIPSATAVLAEYNYLVQKVLFNINILPLVKVVSSFIIQIFLTIILIVMFCVFGYMPDVHYFQLLYYAVYMTVLTAGVCYITAALYIFLKDVIQIVSIVLQILFWFTPIVWNISVMPEKLQVILKYNPVYFIVRGYRKTFIYKEWFWTDGIMSLYYWTIALVIFVLGIKLFRKLKPHFADVL